MQATLTRLYVHWGRAREASHADAYARAGLYWWSWAEPLGPMDDPAAAARKITNVLRTTQRTFPG